ncbi:MAG: UTRA domain-containing protein [Marinobacter sp.]|nr:UTRA domain-containing protein [Marinobacter sp.]
MSHSPLYLELRTRLLALIRTGELPAGSRLPAERLLAERFETTRVTLRQALGQLESEGCIYRSNRRGWFVSPARLVYEPVRDYSFTRYVTAQGRVPRTEVLGFEEMQAEERVATSLSLPVGAPVYRLKRRRYLDNRLVLVETIWLNARFLPGLEKYRFDQSLWQVFGEVYDIELVHKQITITPTALIGEEVAALEVTSGCPGLHITRISKTAAGETIEYDEEYWLHDVLTIALSTSSYG